MARVRTSITLDDEDVTALHAALHSDSALLVLKAIRSMLSQPLATPAGDNSRQGTWLTKIRAGEEVTEDMLTALESGVAARRAFLEDLRAVLRKHRGESPSHQSGPDFDAERVAIDELITAHDTAREVLEVLREIHAEAHQNLVRRAARASGSGSGATDDRGQGSRGTRPHEHKEGQTDAATS